jgi:hypothetical protein
MDYRIISAPEYRVGGVMAITKDMVDQISVLSDRVSASSMSTPGYRTVFSMLVCPSRIGTARRFPVAL